jgi:membrane-associated phospholipid phosphatase
MYSAILLAVLHSAASPAQAAQEPIGRPDPFRVYLVPRLIPLANSPRDHIVLPACKPDQVVFWNEALLRAIKADRTPPPLAARNMAMVHVAIYDAVNAVQPLCRPYGIKVRPPRQTSAEAAAAIAAHRVLVDLYPKQAARFHALLHLSFASIPDGRSKAEGVALGQFLAEKVLAWRERDRSGRKVRYTPPTGPGMWQPTPPQYAAALLPQWPRVDCFAMRHGRQFRPPDPPALTSAAYTAGFHELQALGSKHSRARTPEQTEIAWFWADGDGTVTPPGHWNRIAQTVAQAHCLSLAENARLFALLNIALADAGILSWDCKYHYHFWRPIHGIRRADMTGNPDTEADPDWTPLITTPPFPSYTSGHSTFSAAAAAVLRMYFGTDRIRFTSTSETLPSVTRSFASFSAAAAEAGQSRIYGGIHWQFDNLEGLASGRALGEYVCRHFLVAFRPPAVAENGVHPSRARASLGAD